MADTHTWNHPICDGCWTLRHDVDPVRVDWEYRENEICCFCGRLTLSGIFVKMKPEIPPYHPGNIKETRVNVRLP